MSLLPLARISKYFCCKNHMTNAPVGDNYVNVISLKERATRLSPETQVTLGGYYGGHPPKNGPTFAQKRNNSHALSLFSTSTPRNDSNKAQAA
jgi:hypothetical protein